MIRFIRTMDNNLTQFCNIWTISHIMVDLAMVVGDNKSEDNKNEGE